MPSPHDQDFNWIKALTECSIQFEFQKIKRDIENTVRSQQWAFHEDQSMIQVSRSPTSAGETYSVVLEIQDKCILVKGFGHQLPLCLTLTLDDDANCSFQIDGIGSYKRWQIIRRALEPLLFHRFVSDPSSAA